MDCGKVGALIGRLRRERGLTQRELAGRLLVSDKAVSKWERGAGCPDVSLLAPLAEELGVDLAALLRRTWTRPCCPESCRRPENREEI